MTYQTADYTETPQYNGNIASLSWRVPLGTCRDIQGYNFTYDAANRLKAAPFWERTSGSPTMTDKYSESNINYNLNGNITQYYRRGLTTGSTYALIDQMVYYYDANNPDRLNRVLDLANATNRPYGFKPKGSGSFYYGYDNAGNLTSDEHKDMTVAYNALNLPDVFTFANVTPNNKIEIVYNAAGEKLEKQVYTGATLSTHKRYVMGIEYTGANLEAIYHAEGRIVPIGGGVFRYEYTLKDHLGNSRVMFAANGTAINLLQENHYYPFGMEMKGAWIAQVGTENGYQYNGKELNEDWGLNWSDYGARWYDASVGRWNGVDPSAELYYPYSPYCYVLNRPLNAIDPDGRLVIFVNGINFGDWALQDNKKTLSYSASIPIRTGWQMNNANYQPYPPNRGFTRDNPFNHNGAFEYWGATAKKLWTQVYNDDNHLFVNASSDNSSKAADRYVEGRKAAENPILMLDHGYIPLKEAETIKVIAHSQGAAFAAGLISVLAESEKYGKLIEEIQYLSPHQPSDFEHPSGVKAHQWSSITDVVSSVNNPLTGYSKMARIDGVQKENTHVYDKRNEQYGGHPADSYLNEIIKYYRSKGVKVTVIGK